jgi:anti-sigma factor RsiW
MRCRTARRRLSDELDGTLDAGRLSRLEAHLRACPACRGYRGGLVRLQAEVRPEAGRSAEYWAGFEKRLEARLDREEAGRFAVGRPFAARRRVAWAIAGLALAAVAAASFGLLRSRPILLADWPQDENGFAPLLLEAEADPELGRAVEGEIRASIAEIVPATDADAAALAAADPLFWEGLSEEELGAIAAGLERDNGLGGLK